MENINWAKIFAEKAKRQEVKTKYDNSKDFDFADYLYDFINGFDAKKNANSQH